MKNQQKLTPFFHSLFKSIYQTACCWFFKYIRYSSSGPATEIRPGDHSLGKFSLLHNIKEETFFHVVSRLEGGGTFKGENWDFWEETNSSKELRRRATTPPMGKGALATSQRASFRRVTIGKGEGEEEMYGIRRSFILKIQQKNFKITFKYFRLAETLFFNKIKIVKTGIVKWELGPRKEEALLKFHASWIQKSFRPRHWKFPYVYSRTNNKRIKLFLLFRPFLQRLFQFEPESGTKGRKISRIYIFTSGEARFPFELFAFIGGEKIPFQLFLPGRGGSKRLQGSWKWQGKGGKTRKLKASPREKVRPRIFFVYLAAVS